MESDKDHVHMLIECKPQHYIPNIVKAFKGVSERFLFKEYPLMKTQKNKLETIYKIRKRNEVNCNVTS